VVLHLLVYRQLPFEEPTDRETIRKIVNTPIKLQAPKGLPREFGSLVRALLERDPAKRLSLEELRGHPLVKRSE